GIARPLLQGSPFQARHADLLVILTEGALLVSLFCAGLRLRVPPTVKGWRIAAVLASLGMLVTVVLATLAARLLLPQLGWAAAVLVAAILAPTDPVLAGDVQIDSTTDRDALRVSLTAEGGINDATAAPLALLALGLLGLVPLGDHGMKWVFQDFLWPMVGGVVLGWLFGRAMGWIVRVLLRRGHGLGWDELLYFGVIILAFGLSRLTATSAFLFVFAAALGPMLRAHTAEDDQEPHREREALAERLRNFGERLGRLVEAGMVMLLGVSLAWVQWSLGAVLLALALLFVVRPLAVFCCIPARALPPAQRRLVAWFGIRGVGSMFYLAYALDAGTNPELSTQLADAVLPAIALSIIVHGISATPLMTWYRARRRGGRHAARKQRR
ncbi:MAG TPA: cation:proton antiporter, partial [Burkholderiaceae bacterium]|nr:cation:proton antiporter [Burkholderiaceae bacterium]